MQGTLGKSADTASDLLPVELKTERAMEKRSRTKVVAKRVFLLMMTTNGQSNQGSLVETTLVTASADEEVVH